MDIKMLKKILFSLLLLSTTITAHAEDIVKVMKLYAGEVRTVSVGDIERIAVGNASSLSSTILDNGQLLLIAEAEGVTNIYIWFKDGSEDELTVIIRPAAGPLELKMDEVEELLSHIEGLNIRIVGDRIILSGDIDGTYTDNIETVQGAFPEIMDLSRKLDPQENDVLELPQNKMVIMNIKFTDFNKNFLENLGIQWDASVAGPAAGFAFDAARNDVFRAAGQPATSFSGSLGFGAASASPPLGYFGIASEITSRINFAVNSGNAIILAEPRLAVRSGGEASFLAGGEFPIEISNVNGTTVEFKEFGIKLNVTPEVDQKNNIRASVLTEVSSIDQSVAVNNIPGLLTRRTDTEVSMKSDETLVISGLINQEISKDIQKLKFLGDIPIIGELFKSKSFRDRKSELVIFITPKIFNADSEVNQEQIRKAKENIYMGVEAIDEESIDIVY
jgi:pilus assembly protein CpaC